MYMKPPVYDYPMPQGTGYTLTYGLSVLGMLVLGILPGPVLDLAGLLSFLLP
jgi:hypothetical protein